MISLLIAIGALALGANTHDGATQTASENFQASDTTSINAGRCMETLALASRARVGSNHCLRYRQGFLKHGASHMDPSPSKSNPYTLGHSGSTSK